MTSEPNEPNEWMQGAKQALNDAVSAMAKPANVHSISTERLLAVSQAHSLVSIADSLSRLADSMETLPTVELETPPTVNNGQGQLWPAE